jgi:predicted dehydrogenase
MIHDIDLLLSVMDCPYTSVSAWGQSVLTDHDDTATAWIEFEDGRMANLTASRVHHAPVRQMHLHEQTRQIVIDFANASVVELAAVASLGSMTMEQIRELQSNGLDSVASITNHDVVPGNAIEQEHNDFIDSILLHRQPRVHGERGHDALVLADRIVSEIGRNFGRNSLRPAA